MNNQFQALAMNLIANNPSVRSNPMLNNYINVINSGDAKAGEQIANNICQTYGVSVDDAIKMARNFFHI